MWHINKKHTVLTAASIFLYPLLLSVLWETGAYLWQSLCVGRHAAWTGHKFITCHIRLLHKTTQAGSSGHLSVTSEWIKEAKAVRVNSSQTCLCAIKWGSNRAEMVNMWSCKPVLHFNTCDKVIVCDNDLCVTILNIHKSIC